LIGTLGAVAPETATLPARILGALKHDATADPERQAPKNGPGDALVSTITPKPFGPTAAAAGAVGGALQPASTHMVTMEPTKATNVRMAILLAPARGVDGGAHPPL
jgi:hypothetical protein